MYGRGMNLGGAEGGGQYDQNTWNGILQELVPKSEQRVNCIHKEYGLVVTVAVHVEGDL